ncbi:MAG: HAD family phosphatase, partial [Verrucomicrobiota bacterium]
IFDCDGTVVDSMPLHFRAWCAAFQAHGASFTFTKERFYASAGVAEPDVVTELNAEFGTELDGIAVSKTKAEWFLQHLDELTSVPEVEAIVRQVSAEGLGLAIASGSERHIVEPELEVIGLREFFPIIVTPELVERGKPAPDMFLLAAEQLGVSPNDCLVYEDGQSGLKAAKTAGMDAVFIPTSELL